MRTRPACALFSYDVPSATVPLLDVVAIATAAARLTLLAAKGLLADAEQNMIEPNDVELIHDCADVAEQRLRDVESALQRKESEAAPAESLPAAVVRLARAKEGS